MSSEHIHNLLLLQNERVELLLISGTGLLEINSKGDVLAYCMDGNLLKNDSTEIFLSKNEYKVMTAYERNFKLEKGKILCLNFFML